MLITITQTITRTLNKKPITYAKKGEKVELISVHGDVLIVQGKERFSVRIELTDYERHTQQPAHHSFQHHPMFSAAGISGENAGIESL